MIFIILQGKKTDFMKNGITVIIAAAALVLSCGGNDKSGFGQAMYDNHVTETIMQRRSIRSYLPQPVEMEKLQKIAECGINAPNGKALESWEVRIAYSPDFLAFVDSVYAEQFKDEENISENIRKAAFGAPAIAFIAYDTTYDFSQVDCGLFGGNLILSAQSLGLGTCCLGGLARFVNSDSGKEIREKLAFSSTHKLLYAIAIGYPAEHPQAKPRNPEKVVFL